MDVWRGWPRVAPPSGEERPERTHQTGGVAFWAHVGGFLAGVILIWFFRDPVLVAQHRALARVV